MCPPSIHWRIKRRISVAAIAVVAAVMAAAGWTDASGAEVSKAVQDIHYPIVVGSERQLFVDDVIAPVESMQGLRRTFHQPCKYVHNPILVPEKPWETASRALLPMTVLRDADTGKFRVWYTVWGGHVGKPTYMCVADSEDGLHWTRPNLGLVEFQGSKDNNIIRKGRYFRVLYDPRDPDPARRYKAIIRENGFHAGFSADGLRWDTTVRVLKKAFDSSSVHWDPVGEKWIASCKMWRNDKRVRGYAESQDFLHWTAPAIVLQADEKDGPGDQLYSMLISRYESVFLGLLKVFDTITDQCDAELAFSRDAKHWERPERTPLLPNAPSAGNWDYGNIDPASDPLRVGDELWFYYSGRSTIHYQKPNDAAMGVAMLRADGFASVGGTRQVGALTTRPLVLKGKSLFVNADARGGTLRVEVISGTPSAPPRGRWGQKNCRSLTTDGIRQEIRWKDSPSLEELEEKPVRLRFYLDNARLFSFWTE